MRQRAPGGRVEPALRVANSGAIPSTGRWPYARRRPGHSKRARPRRSASRSSTAPERSSARVGLTRNVREVVGERGLEADVEVGRDRDRGQHQHHPERALQRRPAARAAHPLRPPGGRRSASASSTAAEPSAVGERERDDLRRGALRRADRDHGGEDRPGAGRVDEPERAAHEHARGEAVAARARAEAGEPRQRRLEAGADGGHRERDAEAAQDDDRDRARGAVGEPDPVDDRGQQRDRDREGDRQAEHDPERPPAAAGRGRREQRREHRQHARGQGGAGAGDEREHEQQRHRREVSGAVIADPLRR